MSSRILGREARDDIGAGHRSRRQRRPIFTARPATLPSNFITCTTASPWRPGLYDNKHNEPTARPTRRQRRPTAAETARRGGRRRPRGRRARRRQVRNTATLMSRRGRPAPGRRRVPEDPRGTQKHGARDNAISWWTGTPAERNATSSGSSRKLIAASADGHPALRRKTGLSSGGRRPTSAGTAPSRSGPNSRFESRAIALTLDGPPRTPRPESTGTSTWRCMPYWGD